MYKEAIYALIIYVSVYMNKLYYFHNNRHIDTHLFIIKKYIF